MAPAMEAKIVSRPFDVSDLVNLLIEAEAQQSRLAETRPP